MSRTWLIAAILPALTACAIPEEDFPEEYGKQNCKRLQECNEDLFEEFDDMEDCTDAYADLMEPLLDLADLAGETYDPDGARDCITNLKRADCGDWEDGDFTCDLTL
ncbi:MAG: hypothetical protein VX899_23100 [Myxococcota bacterium]|nr:hypothetical protein [Myxococcota bacterium]